MKLIKNTKNIAAIQSSGETEKLIESWLQTEQLPKYYVNVVHEKYS